MIEIFSSVEEHQTAIQWRLPILVNTAEIFVHHLLDGEVLLKFLLSSNLQYTGALMFIVMSI